jgi:serine-type D-Ala-D-Ala carboxypeptidase (penicillin-binding protein 5/6)
MRKQNSEKEIDETGFFSDVPETKQVSIFPISAQLTVLSVMLLTIFGTGLMPKILAFFDNNNENQSATIPLIIENEASEWDEEKKGSFENISIRGKSAFVWDINNQKILFEKNPDERLPLASITKLMTALVAYEIVSTDSKVPISISALLQDGDSGLRDGNVFSLASLTELTLTSSSNDGAFAMAAAAGALLDKNSPATAFVNAMNLRAEELGLTKMEFKNPTGLDVSETEAGAYGSARDTAFLMEYILKHYPEILEASTAKNVAIADNGGQDHLAENTNEVIDEIAGLIGSKTGYTTLAGGNLTVAFDASLNRPIIVVVLNSSRSGRFDDVLKLIDATKEYLN